MADTCDSTSRILVFEAKGSRDVLVWLAEGPASYEWLVRAISDRVKPMPAPLLVLPSRDAPTQGPPQAWLERPPAGAGSSGAASPEASYMDVVAALLDMGQVVSASPGLLSPAVIRDAWPSALAYLVDGIDAPETTVLMHNALQVMLGSVRPSPVGNPDADGPAAKACLDLYRERLRAALGRWTEFAGTVDLLDALREPRNQEATQRMRDALLDIALTAAELVHEIAYVLVAVDASSRAAPAGSSSGAMVHVVWDMPGVPALVAYLQACGRSLLVKRK
jgi:hypothetical protein